MSTTPDIPTLSVALDPETIEALALAVARQVAELVAAPPQDGWLDGYEAADYLGMPYSTFKRKTAAGIIEGRPNPDGGRRLYYRRSYLDDWRNGDSA